MKSKSPALCLALILIVVSICQAEFDVVQFKNNFDQYIDQTALVGKIDSLTIKRGNFEFNFRNGQMSLLDFGCGVPCAFLFEGDINFKYTPPNEIEAYQLKKFSGKDSVNYNFNKLVMFYTVQFDNFPDTTKFIRALFPQKSWYDIRDAQNDAVSNLGHSIEANMAGDLFSGTPGTYIYTDFYINEFDHFGFIEDPRRDDKYRLYKYMLKHNDVWGAYTDESYLASCRGYNAIDITHYDIDSQIESGENMICKCRVYFTPLSWGQKYIPLTWHYQNKPIAAFDSNGDSLNIINRKDCHNFGVVLNKPMVLGEADYIDIEYKNETLVNIWGFYLSKNEAYWYPQNPFYDKATFDLTFKCPEDFTVVASAMMTESVKEGNYYLSKWHQDYPVIFMTFNLGLFDTKEYINENTPPLRYYNWKMKRRMERQEETCSDILAALNFFNIVLGPCPFDTIKAADMLIPGGQSAPGLLYLSALSTTVDYSANKSVFEQFRSHEVAHQWFGHIVSTENYRDYWIIEGLAEYSGFLFYQSAFKNDEMCENILDNLKRSITVNDGTKAGPLTLGYRLNSSKSSDYSTVVYDKGAYIFHMIRYLFHDFSTDSDEAFAAFLKDIIDTYKNKPITTANLKQMLDKHMESDMTWFFDQWVYGTDVPTYEFSYKTTKNADGKYIVDCHIVQKDVPDDFMMYVPLTVVFEGDKYAHFELLVTNPVSDIQLPPLPMEPKKLDFNTYDAVLANVYYR